MATRKISELAAASGALLDTDLVEGEKIGALTSVKFTGYQVREVERLEREEQDDVIEASVGLDVDGNLIPFTGAYTSGATTIANAIELLESSIETGLMDKATYDPSLNGNNVYDMDNMEEGLSNKILTNGTQNIQGVKTFTDTPKCANVPALDSELVNKLYVDSFAGDMQKSVYDPNEVEADVFDMDNMVNGDTNVVLTVGAQDIKGKKTFEIFPVTPSTTPTDPYDVANKLYVESVALGIKGQASAALGKTVVATGTLPVVTNANNIVNINLTSVESPTTVSLGSMSAKKFWEGSPAEYAAIGTKDANTIYYVFE